MRASAKHAEIALMLANEIVEKVLHEDVQDNPALVVGVMAAIAQNFAAMTIREGLDDIASAIRESTMTERFAPLHQLCPETRRPACDGHRDGFQKRLENDCHIITGCCRPKRYSAS
jgi:hypothetical protein